MKKTLGFCATACIGNTLSFPRQVCCKYHLWDIFFPVGCSLDHRSCFCRHLTEVDSPSCLNSCEYNEKTAINPKPWSVSWSLQPVFFKYYNASRLSSCPRCLLWSPVMAPAEKALFFYAHSVLWLWQCLFIYFGSRTERSSESLLLDNAFISDRGDGQWDLEMWSSWFLCRDREGQYVCDVSAGVHKYRYINDASAHTHKEVLYSRLGLGLRLRPRFWISQDHILIYFTQQTFACTSLSLVWDQTWSYIDVLKLTKGPFLWNPSQAEDFV